MSDDISENPFCTRHIRPGAIPFLFAAGHDAETLIERLRQNGWWGEIVGPHGSGKSALLATLIPLIELAERHAVLVELHDGQRRVPLNLDRECRTCVSTVVIVDGYEQLSRWNRWLLKRLCRRRGWGLLVTSHVSVGLPCLYQTATSTELAEKIVTKLLAGQIAPWPSSELAECLLRYDGNLRETLFHLYDLHEEKRRIRGATTIMTVGDRKYVDRLESA
jgi:hypothetical protein